MLASPSGTPGLIRLVLVIAAGILTAAVCMELILNLTDRYSYQALGYDPATGLIRYQPDSEYPSSGSCYDLTAHMDNLGLYGPDLTIQKPAGVYRVVVVGNSFTESIQVPLDERFDALATKELNAHANGVTYEVDALGFPANGNYLSMLYYKEYMAQLHPDLVIDLMTDSTLVKDGPGRVDAPRFDANGNAVLELPAAKRDSTVIQIKTAARQSKLFEALYRDFQLASVSAHGSLHPNAATTTAGDGMTAPTASWDTEANLLASFKALAEGSGAKFAVASWTTDDTKDRTFMKAHLSPITTKLSIPFIDLTAPIDAEAAQTSLSAMLPCNGHWGVHGHQWVADILAAYIRAHS